MDTYINLGTKFKLDKYNRELVNLKTGEVYRSLDDVKHILGRIKYDKEFNRSMERAIRETWGIKTELETYHQKWKSDSWFVKIYRTEMREYKEKIKLSHSAGLVLLYIQDYIEYKTNRIINKNGKPFTNKELASLIGINKNTVADVLNELEHKKFIKRIGNRRAREIYFNPYLATAGNEIDKDTVKMFNSYEPVV